MKENRRGDWEEDVEMMMTGGAEGEFSMERGDYDLMSRRLEGKKREASEGASTFKSKLSFQCQPTTNHHQQHHTESA
jgi:hypothetical protein